MALLTPLSLEEAHALVGAWGFVLESIVPLPAHGTVNSNFRVWASGRPWFLRINEGKRDEDVVAEAELVTRLRAGGLPTPEVIRTQAGAWFAAQAGKPATLFPWIEGREAEPRLDQPSTVEVVGRALGLLHRAGAGLEPASLPRNHYDLDELQRRLARFADDRRFAEIVPVLEEELDRARRASGPSGLIHQDLFPDNLLVDGEGELVAVLDLEQATYGRFSYDLAVSATSWCWDGRAHAREAMAAMLRAYESVRPLATSERASLTDELRLAAARFTITRITDVFLPDGVDEDLRRRKDWREYAARLVSLRA
jgi:homoserine kinase type II